MGWSRLADVCIHDGKLLGCSYDRNSIGVWVVDVSLIKPYGAGSTPEQNDCLDEKSHVKLQGIMDKVETDIRGPGLHCTSPDYDTKEIKNIYVDSAGGKPVTSQRINSSKVLPPLDLRKPVLRSRFLQQGCSQSLMKRRSINPWFRLASYLEAVPMQKIQLTLEENLLHFRKVGLSSQIKTVSEDSDREACKEKHSAIKSVEEKFEAVLSLKRPSDHETRNRSLNNSKEMSPVKVVNGVAVVPGRTRTLVERFESIV